MIWLDEKQVIKLHDDVVNATGGTLGIRDSGMLSSALCAPMQSYGGVEMFPTAAEKICRLAFALTEFHPFIDGNKRAGAHTLLVLCALNGIGLKYTQKELIDLFISLASSKVEYEGVLKFVKEHLKES